MRALPLKLPLRHSEVSTSTLEGVIGYLQVLRDGIKTNSNAVCIFQGFAPPVETLFGSLDRALLSSIRSLIDRINRELAELILSSGDVLLDVATCGVRRSCELS
jgi:hypothetical protein